MTEVLLQATPRFIEVKGAYAFSLGCGTFPLYLFMSEVRHCLGPDAGMGEGG